MAERVRISLTCILAEGADVDAAGEQVFNLVASDALDLAPLVAEVEGYDIDQAES